MGYFNQIAAEPAAQAASVEYLKSQLLAQNPNINWNIQGIDRAQELANFLASRGVNDISNASLKWDRQYTAGGTPDFTSESGFTAGTPGTAAMGGYLDFGDGVTLGNEGNIKTGNGKLGYFPDSSKPAFASSTEGHGAVSYQYRQGPDGKIQLIPKWVSTSDMGAVRDVLKAGLVAVGGFGLAGMGPLSGLGEALGTAGSSAGGFSAGAVDSAALGLDGVAVGGSGTVGGGITAGGSAGYGSIASGAGVSPYSLGAGGGSFAGSGLTAPSLAAGSGLGSGLGITAGAGTALAGSGGGSLLSGLGSYLTSGSGIDSLLSLASGAYGLKLAGDAREASDPFAQYRAGYGEKLAALEANPGTITTRPGFQAGIDTIKRTTAANGYYGSGNMASALSRYSGDFYTQEANRLAGLAGANATPGNGQISSAGLASQSLGSIGYGIAPLIQSLLKGY